VNEARLPENEIIVDRVATSGVMAFVALLRLTIGSYIYNEVLIY
jgi:hypothetical protein